MRDTKAMRKLYKKFEKQDRWDRRMQRVWRLVCRLRGHDVVTKMYCRYCSRCGESLLQ